jgi:hypothetical protein
VHTLSRPGGAGLQIPGKIFSTKELEFCLFIGIFGLFCVDLSLEVDLNLWDNYYQAKAF